jgi:type I restriction-modification system DNA methylase subunit
MLDTVTKRRIDTARDILVGKVPDPKSQVEQITIALIYKFMDDMDAEAEELGGKRKFFTGDFARYGWAKLMSAGMGGHELIGLYGEGIATMPQNPGIPALFRDIFKNAYLPYRDPETLKSFLKIIDEFSYDHSERLGDAYEYLLSVLGSQGDAGQFRTPRHIIGFMVEIMDPKKNETLIDTACGTAGFLISAYKHILKHNSKDYQPKQNHATDTEKGAPLELLILESPLHYQGDLLTPDERKRLAGNIKGYDISPDMVRMSLVNLYLHGFNDPHIFEYDTLTSEERWDEYADVIFANPPFMSPKGGIKPHKRFSIQAKRSEVLFVDYIAEHLTPAGRAAIIVPEGIIFQSQTAYKALRKMLVERSLVAVISLPGGVFQPYSGVKTSILILDKALAKQSDSIAFFKIENDGFGLGAQRRAIAGEQLTQVKAELDTYLNALRTGEFTELRAKGPASSQPGATPQEIAPHDTKGLKARPISGANDESGFQPSDVSGNHEPGAMPQAGMKCAVGASVTSTIGANHSSLGHRPGNVYPTGEERLKARPISEVCLIVSKEKIAANGDYNLSGERYREGDQRASQYPHVELGEVVEILDSLRRPITKSDRTPGPYPYYGATGVLDHVEGYLFDEALVLVGEDGAKWRAGENSAFPVEGKVWVNNHAHVLRPKRDLLLDRYLIEILNEADLMPFVTGVTVPKLNQEKLRSIQIPLPPLEVQKEIVAEIEGYQKEIEHLKAEIATQEKNIQKAIARVWGEDSYSANGAPSSQPGATPQELGSQKPKG